MDNQTPSTPITPPPSVPSVIQTPTQKPTVYLIFFTILFLAVFSIAGYFGYQNLPAVKVDRLIKNCLSRGGALGESYPPQCFTPTPTITTTLTPTPDTANWKTYNYQQLFEIKIPNDLKIIDNGRIEIGDYLSIGTYPTNPEACRGDCAIIETKVSKTINGLEVRYLTGWWGEIGGNIAQSYIEYLIPQNGKYIYLQMQELPFSTKISLVREKVGKVSEVNSKLLDQILSTFKFLDQTSGVDTSNWKTYTNNKCKYQISYPESWMLFPEPEKAIYGVAVLVSYGNEKKPNDNNWLKVQIGCGAVSAGDSPRQTIDKLNARDSGYGVPKVESLGQTTVNGKIAYKQIMTAPVGDPVLEYYIFVDDTSFVNIGFTPSTSKLSAEIQQIVSSFRFIK